MAKRILVVDDSESIRELVSMILENAGYEITKAIDGADALVMLDDHSFDMILTDLNMPRVDGISLIRGVRANDRYGKLPIIMLTTESSTSLKDEAKAAGATGWIIKPFVADKLLAVINKVMR
jgi:two-component system chemotaxis response regulator CheY